MNSLFQSLGRKGKELVKKTMGNKVDESNAATAGAAATYNKLQPPTYNIVSNPEFKEGTDGWFGLGCNLGLGEYNGCNYCIAQDRKETWSGVAQEIGERLEIDVDYRVEVWVGIGGQAEEANVQATLKLDDGNDYVWLGSVTATKDKWSLLTGTFRISKLPKTTTFYVEGPHSGIDIRVSSVALIPSTPPESQVASRTGPPNSGGLIHNPGFVDGLRDWREKGCKVFLSESMEGGRILPSTGKYFAVATNRTGGWQGIEQDITGHIEESTLYKVTGLVRINGNVSDATVLATIYMKGEDGKDQYITLGKVQAFNTQWTEIQGEFLVNKLPKQATVYLEGPPQGVDILVDNFAMFTPVRARPAGPVLLRDPKFGVNIIENSNVEYGLDKWYSMGNCRLTIADGRTYRCPMRLGATACRSFVRGPPPDLNGKFLYVSNRTQVWEGPAQTITDKIQLFHTYQVSAWVATTLHRGSQMLPTPQKVNVALSVDGNWMQGGEVLAGADWTEVSGSFRLETKPEKVIVYIQGPAPGVDVMVAGLHIFGVERLARIAELREQTDKVRKRDVVVRLFDSNGNPLSPGNRVEIQQLKNSFPIGSVINHWSLDNKAYRQFFLDHFNWAVFENELKWGWTEPNKGDLKYENADEMVEFCNSNGIPMRGHCILWETEDTVQDWVKQLDARELADAVQNRVTGLLSRYHGKFKHYDVNNEMLHGSFYKDALGPQFLPYLFKLAHQFDPEAVLFVNDYHVEDGEDCMSSAQRYVEHIQDLLDNGAPVGGIGIQGHLNVPVGPILSQALDVLGSLGLPIWFTEVDVESANEHVRADDLEVTFREAFAHPAVEGLMLWGFWEGTMCRKNAHLVDSDKRINEAGRRLISLKKEWLTTFEAPTNAHGELIFRGFLGDYILSLPAWGIHKTFDVTKGEGPLVVNITV